jgi:hypothetical protein
MSMCGRIVLAPGKRPPWGRMSNAFRNVQNENRITGRIRNAYRRLQKLQCKCRAQQDDVIAGLKLFMIEVLVLMLCMLVLMTMVMKKFLYGDTPMIRC